LRQLGEFGQETERLADNRLIQDAEHARASACGAVGFLQASVAHP
jgi:hypothetical protein